MIELVSHSWRLQEDADRADGAKCCHQPKRLKRGPVTDILLWADCYAAMVAVLVEKFSDKAAEFFIYMKTIVLKTLKNVK